MRPLALATALLLLTTFTLAQGGFQAHTYAAPYDTHLIAQDLNRDGFADLVMFGGPLTVKLNDGHGAFGANLAVAGANADFVALADFNGDGLPDIAACTRAATGYSSTITLYLNHGAGSFASSYSTTIPYACTNIIAGDVTGNGKADVVIPANRFNSTTSNYENIVITFFGNGAGALGAHVSEGVALPAVQNPSQISGCFLGPAVGADFLKAGRVDLILLGDCQAGPTNGGTIYYGASDKAGHYALKEITEDVRSYDYNLPYVTDVDSNGLLDVVLISYQSGPHGSWDNELEFLVNQGGGAFALKRIFDENTYAASYLNGVFSGAAGRFNNDKIDDAVVGFTESPNPCCQADTPGVAVLDGVGHFNYSNSARWNVGGYPFATIAADFNHDGRSDIAVLTHNINTSVNALVVYLNQGTNMLCPAPSSPGVNVCAPNSSQSYTSPVAVVATGKGASGTVNHLELWIDSKKVGNYAGATMNTTVSLATGSHNVVVIEVDSKGAFIKSTPVGIYVQ